MNNLGANTTQIGGDHYKRMGIQPWEVIDTWPVDQKIGYYRGTVLSYVMRAGMKGAALEDYMKARHVLDKLIEVLSNPQH